MIKKEAKYSVKVLKDIGFHKDQPSLRMEKLQFLKTGEELPDVIKKL